MQIIDRYIIRQFLTNFLILLVVFMSLFVLADLIIDIDEFVKAGEYHARMHGGSKLMGTLRAVVTYYPPMMALIYVFVSGVLVVGAMGFTLGGLLRSRELMILVASGVNMYRIAMPLLLVGCLLNLLNIVNQQVVIPPLADRLTIGKSELGRRQGQRQPIWFSPDGQGNLFSAADFNLPHKMLTHLVVLTRDERGNLITRTTASEAFWNDQRQGWELTMGTTEHYGPAISAAAPGGATGRGITEASFIASDLTPRVLLARRKTIYPRLLSFDALRDLRSNPAVDGDKIRQIMHSRFSLVVVNVLVLAIGMPFFLRLTSATLYLNAVRAATVCLGAWAAGVVMLQLGGSAVNPVLAAWLPVVVYLPLTFVFMQFVKT